MEMDAWLCIVTSRKIFGIKLSNLKEFVDLESVPRSSEFDFSMDTKGHYSVPFQFDSKIYFGAGIRFSVMENGYVEEYENRKIYEFDIVEEDEDEQGKISAAGKLIEAPIPVSPYQLEGFYIANINPDVYFLRVFPGEMCIFALRSSTRTWQSLSLPCRQFCDGDSFWHKKSEYQYCDVDSFVLNNKIFTYFSPGNKSDGFFFCSLDPAAAEERGWEVKDRPMLKSFHINPYLFPCYPHITVSVPGLTDANHSVTLSWSFALGDSYLSKVAIIALLVNEQGVVTHQQLDECFGWIESSFDYFTVSNKIFQFENGEVCAMFYGHLVELKLMLLCISIFKICKDSSVTGTAGEQKRILSVHVIRKSVYSVYPFEDSLVGAFSLPSKKNKLLTNLNRKRKAPE